MDVMLIIVVALVPVVLQLIAISMYSDRMARALRRAADTPPYTTAVVIHALGPAPRSVVHVLDRATRLDAAEVDELIETRGGRIPLLMSRPAAQRLVRDLRGVGADAEALYASDTHTGPRT